MEVYDTLHNNKLNALCHYKHANTIQEVLDYIMYIDRLSGLSSDSACS